MEFDFGGLNGCFLDVEGVNVTSYSDTLGEVEGVVAVSGGGINGDVSGLKGLFNERLCELEWAERGVHDSLRASFSMSQSK